MYISFMNFPPPRIHPKQKNCRVRYVRCDLRRANLHENPKRPLSWGRYTPCFFIFLLQEGSGRFIHLLFWFLFFCGGEVLFLSVFCIDLDKNQQLQASFEMSRVVDWCIITPKIDGATSRWKYIDIVHEIEIHLQDAVATCFDSCKVSSTSASSCWPLTQQCTTNRLSFLPITATARGHGDVSNWFWPNCNFSQT